jgi:hypothetical protein
MAVPCVNLEPPFHLTGSPAKDAITFSGIFLSETGAPIQSEWTTASPPPKNEYAIITGRCIQRINPPLNAKFAR